MDYLDTIGHVLKPGGIWCNFGPLLYHFENDHGVETTYEVNPYSGFQDKINDYTPLMGLELSSDDIISIATNHLDFELIRRVRNTLWVWPLRGSRKVAPCLDTCATIGS